MTTYYTVDRLGECRTGLEFTYQMLGIQISGTSEIFNVPVSRHGLRYVPMDVRNNNAMIEGIFEMVRAQHFPEKPTRFCCMFACESLEALNGCEQAMQQTSIRNIYSVEYAGAVHRGDMSLLASDGSLYEVQSRAMAYWMGETKDLYPDYVPRWEILIPLPVQLGELLL
ncbi:DUF2441 domain-containing protein [Enterobacter asburiae]|uniref:DUF2441 domain-containing protein n=1 Tax=Enterobacter asburiae TaxID=61645 RepID=UPI00188899BE|nr:DUF2441 domain-containing protein [Enterobacter asburiae]MBF1982807.1 DUF2441 domain-containing protein [Enterobacter asburiae]